MSTRDNLTRLWQSSPPLVVVGVLMLAAAAASAIGILTDPREITGARRG